MSRAYRSRTPKLEPLREESTFGDGPDSAVLSFDSRSSAPADWATFEAFLKERGDVSGQLVTYLDGMLEVFMPGETHELVKKTIARLIELWALELDVHLAGYGSLLLKSKRKAAGLEPDECYLLGVRGKRQAPDIAIEIVWSRGALNKLEVYRRLGVREVWVWEGGELKAHVLEAGGWRLQGHSELLPSLDFKLLSRFSTMEDQHRAVKQFRAILRRSVH
ncbi:MAG: Uma2 family endonuclease [Myxococcaceae bacterium]|nr:Uma2 family endonuclease [Myxococcaceae bacterium]